MRNTKKRAVWRAFQVFASSFIAVAIVGTFVYVTQGRAIPVLQPQGSIAQQQYELIMLTVILGAFVVIPVFILLFSIAWRYRAGNKKAKYDPEFGHHTLLEIVWWGIPFLIITFLAVVTYISTFALDPYKAIESSKDPVNVQVIALEGNWLFVYPDRSIATLNYMAIPEDTPISLTITSDAPMNSFWVPALAGQVYAMSGMSTKLHLIADTTGSYDGSTSNISGEGYAKMRFKVRSVREAEFINWAFKAAQSTNVLSTETYAKLAQPSDNLGEITYTLTTPTLYNDVIMKYMAHGGSSESGKQDTTHAHGGAE